MAGLPHHRKQASLQCHRGSRGGDRVRRRL